jgi:zinc protease
MAPDPAVRTGTFANGLRYAVMRNATPSGAVSIRLALRVGSYEESDAELGFAHFVEHMAFRSTKGAPQGSLDTRFAGMGVAFGRDQNASTGLEATIYRMDLPRPDPAGLDAVLGWLRDAADGILFTPAAIELEKGVVLAEIHARTSPASLMMRETARFQAPELRSVHREPGGTEASIRGASPAALQAFYDRWYRPDNATLVIVGDADPDILLKAAEAAFAGWKARGTPGERPRAPETLPERGLDTFTRSDPALPTALSACRTMPLDGPRDGSFAALRREALSQLWTTVLTGRTARLVSKEGSPLLAAAPLVNRGIPDGRVSCLVLIPTAGRWKEALAAGQAELRRFAGSGPTETEVKEAANEMLSRLGGAAYTSATRQTRALADQIADSELGGRPFMHPKEAHRVVEVALSGVTPADVLDAFRRDWAGNGPLLALAGPEAVAKEDLAAAWKANEGAAPLQAYEDRTAAEWAYWDFGKKGKVRTRSQVADGGFTRSVFRNGVVLSHKQTRFESGGVEIRVRFGHGERGLAPAERLPAMLAAGAFPLGGLGKMTFEEVGEALANSTWSFGLDVQATGFVLTTSTISAHADQQMRLLAAYMSDPAFRPAIDDKLPTAIDMLYRSYKTDPVAVANQALEAALFPDRPSLPPREQIAAWRAADLTRLLKPALVASPIEVTVVGDYSLAQAEAAVAETFGALKPRKPLAAPAGGGPFRSFPATIPRPVTAFHDGPREKAAAVLMWPLYVANPERRREEYAIGLLRSIFETRLLHQVRAVMGKVYSPVVTNVMIDQADQGFISATIEATPAEIDELAAAARRIAGELAAGAIRQEEVDAARKPLLAANDEMLVNNNPWAGVISHSVRAPDAIAELTRYRSDMESLRLEDIRAVAAAWLKRDPAIARSVPAPR